jgi:hypothetical protein
LHAPAAGFGDREFYPDFIEKAAVLAIASGDWSQDDMTEWLGRHLKDDSL